MEFASNHDFKRDNRDRPDCGLNQRWADQKIGFSCFFVKASSLTGFMRANNAMAA